MKMRVSQPCRTCGGDCRVVHPHWKQYHAQLGVHHVTDFFLNLGYLPDEHLPPVVVSCPTCKGAGTVRAMVEMPQGSGLLHLLGQVLYRALGGCPL